MTSLSYLAKRSRPYSKRVHDYVTRYIPEQMNVPEAEHIQRMDLLINHLYTYRPTVTCMKCKEALDEGFWIRTHVWERNEDGVMLKIEDHSRQIFCEDCAGDDRYTKYYPIDGEMQTSGFHYNRLAEKDRITKLKGKGGALKLQLPETPTTDSIGTSTSISK